MSQNYHTPITTGAAANAATINGPLGQLDSQLSTTATEVIAARGGYASLDTRLDNLVLAGGNVATLTNGAASAGQKVVTVDSSTGFVAGANVVYTLAGGTLEYNAVGTVDTPTQITLTTNIGSGGIANDTYFTMISPSEAAAAQYVNAGNGVSQTLPVAVQAALAGRFVVTAYGAVGDGTANDTAAIQAAIDAAWAAGGGIVVLPVGDWKVTGLEFYRDTVDRLGGGKEIVIVGAGRGSRLFSSTAAPVFTWEAWASGKYSSKVTLLNLYVQNTAAGGSIALWASHDAATDRLAFRATECIFEYFGGPNDGNHGVGCAFDFDGLIASQMLNCWINGGSPIGGGATIGWAAKIKHSSQCTFANIYMGTGDLGSAGRGFWVHGGGDNMILGMRLDTGSRFDGPSFYFDDTKGWHVHQLRGEGKDSSAFIHIKDSHNLTFYDANVPSLDDDATTRNGILIENSSHITFYSCTVKSQDYYGNGKSIVIDQYCSYVRFYRLVMVLFDGQTTYSDDIDDDGTLTMFDGSWGTGGEDGPPTSIIMAGAMQTPPLRVGENGTLVSTILHATAAWDPGSIANGATESTTVTMSNVAVTDTIIGLSYTSIGSADWTLRGHLYNDTGTIKAKVWLTNNTGNSVDLADGVVTVVVGRFPYTHL